MLPFADLGWEGRRYVTDVITPHLIENVMGERRWLNRFAPMSGFNSEPRYRTGRAELALAELERTAAFDRSTLLLVSPTGTGWVDHTLIEAAEFLARGDIATCHPVRQIPLVPVPARWRSAEPSSGCCSGESSYGWLACRRRSATGAGVR